MSIGRYLTVRVLARAIRRANKNPFIIGNIYGKFRKTHSHRSPEWRVNAWKDALERVHNDD